MNEQIGKIVLHYEEETPVTDAATGDVNEGHQLVIILKAQGDEKEYTHQIPLGPNNPPNTQLDEWRDKGQLVVISASSVRATAFAYREKDDDGNPMKYPQPGKIFKVANKTIEVGTVLSFSSYAIRAATEEDRKRSEEANGLYLARQQQSRMRSIQKRKDKAHARTQQRIQDSKTKKK